MERPGLIQTVAAVFKSPRLARLQANENFRLVVFALSACVFAFSLNLAWLASSNPLEIEVREGSVWMHALAKSAGVDIYDTTRVAFVNMNHGPFDAILKGWITTIAPGLPGHVVTRTFVLLGPVFLFVSAFVITRGHMAAAVLAAGALFLFLCHMTTMTYVGRSDATSLCLLVVCGALAHRLLVTRHRNWSNRRHIAAQVGLGAASAALFLTSWRYIVPIAALQVVVVSSQIADEKVHSLPNRSLRRLGAWLRAAPRNVSISTALYLAGFAAVWLPVFLQQLHGDFRSYYRHFFGFFTGQSGWGTYAGPRFRLLPDEVVDNRLGSLLFLAALMLWGLYRLRKQTAELLAWTLMLSATWLAVSYGYYKNQGGGGQHYYVEFFGFAWIFVLHAFSRGHRWGPLTQLVLVVAVVLALPMGDLLTQQDMLVDARAKGRKFRAEVARLTSGQPVFSEELHLFRLEYRGELVDTGDTDAVLARTGYFGAALTRTYDRHIEKLLADPPKFVLAAMFGDNPRIVSPPLHSLLKSRYALRVSAPGSAFAIGGGQALFERKD